MNKVFNYLTAELARTDEQLPTVNALADAVEDDESKAAAATLAESKLELYFTLCEVVQTDPSLVHMCARALQRVEVIQFLLDRKAEYEHNPDATALLGTLATDHATEKENLETFFTLFAPEHEGFVAYSNPTATAVTEVPTPEAQIDSSPPPMASSRPSTTITAPEASTSNTVIELLVSGEGHHFTPLEAFVLENGSKFQDGDTEKKLKAGMFLNEPRFNELLLAAKGREISYSGKASNLRKLLAALNEKFPAIFEEGGIRGGAWIRFNTGYSIEQIEPEVTTEIAETGTTTATATITPPSTPTQGPQLPPPAPVVPPPVRPPASQPKIAPAKPVEQRKTHHPQRRMDSGTKLLPHGFMIDRKITEFTEFERAAIHVINGAERKEPYSAGRIGESLRTEGLTVNADAIDFCLRELSEKLPKGWLIRVRSGKDKPFGWRLGKGIRIVKQHGT